MIWNYLYGRFSLGIFRIKSPDMFSICNWGFPSVSLRICCCFNMESHCFNVCVYQWYSCYSLSDSQIIFTRENHWRMMSLVTQNSVFTINHTCTSLSIYQWSFWSFLKRLAKSKGNNLTCNQKSFIHYKSHIIFSPFYLFISLSLSPSLSLPTKDK